MKWQEIIRLGLSELVEETGLGTPKVELAGSTPVFVWVTTTETFIALPEIVECTLWHVAYQHPHQYNVSDTISLLSLSDAASLANQVDRDSPNGPYKEIFVTLQTLVRQELQRLQQERLWDNVRMSQVPHDTQNYNHSSARYLFLVLLAQIGSPAQLTYYNRRIVIPPHTGEEQCCVHQALGETYLVRQAHSSGAVTVMYRLLNTKEKVLARLTVDALHEIAKHGIEYDMEELKQWQGLEAWGLSEVCQP
jgi:hypothetical protein